MNSCEVQLSLIKFTELRKKLIATRSTENKERQSLIDIFDLRTVKKKRPVLCTELISYLLHEALGNQAQFLKTPDFHTAVHTKLWITPLHRGSKAGARREWLRTQKFVRRRRGSPEESFGFRACAHFEQRKSNNTYLNEPPRRYSYFEKGCRKKWTRQSRKVLWVVLS